MRNRGLVKSKSALRLACSQALAQGIRLGQRIWTRRAMSEARREWTETRLAMSEAAPRGVAESNGAEERTRTFTRLPGLAPEASASANSATSARWITRKDRA